MDSFWAACWVVALESSLVMIYNLMIFIPGYQFAMTSMKTVLSSLLRRYEVLPAEHSSHSQRQHRPIRLKFDLMMKDADGFQIQLKHRSKPQCL